MKITIITVSDRASKGEYQDLSGPEIESILKETVPEVDIRRSIVPDDLETIINAMESYSDADYIITTGGTGIGPRDVTPEATALFCEKELPGIAEELRRESCKETDTAMLSRGQAGIKKHTIVINFPGSLRAVRLCTRIIIPVLEHGIKMLNGEGH